VSAYTACVRHSGGFGVEFKKKNDQKHFRPKIPTSYTKVCTSVLKKLHTRNQWRENPAKIFERRGRFSRVRPQACPQILKTFSATPYLGRICSKRAGSNKNGLVLAVYRKLNCIEPVIFCPALANIEITPLWFSNPIPLLPTYSTWNRFRGFGRDYIIPLIAFLVLRRDKNNSTPLCYLPKNMFSIIATVNRSNNFSSSNESFNI